MSGRKNFLAGFKTISAGDASLTSVTSAITNIQGLDNLGVQFNVTSGTFSGSLVVQVSADYNQNLNTGNWINVNLPVSATITSSSPTNIYIDLTNLSAPWIRAVYTKTSGTGNFDVILCGKMI